MSTDKPVIVYGASGYTGRLVCEYLREYHVPFVAAGRDKARIQEAMDKGPGIETVEHEIVEVAHDVGPLTELFDGARVVLSTGCSAARQGSETRSARSPSTGGRAARPAPRPAATTWTPPASRTG